MKKQEFQQLFENALELAAINAEKQLKRQVSRNFIILLYGGGYSGSLMTSLEVLDHLYLGEQRFYRIIDVAVVEVGSISSKVFLRISQHDPTNFGSTWNNPPGSGPFKQLVAESIHIVPAQST